MSETIERLQSMRLNRPSAVQRGLAAALDLGSSKVSCALLKFDQRLMRDEKSRSPRLRPAVRVEGAATLQSRGIRLGEIEDREEVVNLVRQLLARARGQSRTLIDHAYVCTSGGKPTSNNLFHSVAIGGNEVSSDDVAGVISECKLPDLPDNRTLLSVQPVNFSVDQRSTVTRPIGMRGHRLSADLHMVDVDLSTFDSIMDVLGSCNLDVCGIVSSAHVSGLAALVEDERDLGGACVDIGAGVTSISVYFKGQLVCARTIKLGGQHITADISRMLSISESAAERLKSMYGSLYFDPRHEGKEIEILSATRGARKISHSSLFRLIRPRMEEILEEVNLVLDGMEFEALPGQRIVLTGGCSNMQGLDELARDILGSHVRFGRPLRLSGLPQEISGPQYSALVGTCLDALTPQIDISDFLDSGNALARFAPGNALAEKPWSRTIQWMASNW